MVFFSIAQNAGFPDFPTICSCVTRSRVCVRVYELQFRTCWGSVGIPNGKAYKLDTRREHELFLGRFEVLRFIFSAVVFGGASSSYSYVTNIPAHVEISHTHAQTNTFVCQYKWTHQPQHAIEVVDVKCFCRFCSYTSLLVLYQTFDGPS